MGGGAGAPGRRGPLVKTAQQVHSPLRGSHPGILPVPLCLDTNQEHGHAGERAQAQVAPAPPSRGHLGTAGAPWRRPVSWPNWCRATGTVGRARAKACSPRVTPSCRAIWQPCHRQADANRGQGVREATRQQTADARATNSEARLQHHLFQTVISHSPFGRRFSSSGCAVSPHWLSSRGSGGGRGGPGRTPALGPCSHSHHLSGSLISRPSPGVSQGPLCPLNRAPHLAVTPPSLVPPSFQPPPQSSGCSSWTWSPQLPPPIPAPHPRLAVCGGGTGHGHTHTHTYTHTHPGVQTCLPRRQQKRDINVPGESHRRLHLKESRWSPPPPPPTPSGHCPKPRPSSLQPAGPQPSMGPRALGTALSPPEGLGSEAAGPCPPALPPGTLWTRCFAYSGLLSEAWRLPTAARGTRPPGQQSHHHMLFQRLPSWPQAREDAVPSAPARARCADPQLCWLQASPARVQPPILAGGRRPEAWGAEAAQLSLQEVAGGLYFPLNVTDT